MSLTANFQPTNPTITRLDETVNYVSLYSIVKDRMEQPTDLLETIATEVAAKILQQFEKVEEVYISVKKLNPPIVAFQGSVGVSYHLKREE